MSKRDPLTGLYDRASFTDRLDEAFTQAVREAGKLALMVFDLDQFKAFNDSHGHQLGDALIRYVGELIDGAFEVPGFVGRYGGEEFLAAVPGCGVETGTERAEGVRAKLADTTLELSANGQHFTGQATLSVGVAVYPDQARDVKDLLRKAEQSLYLAKEQGRNRVCVYEEKDGLTGLLSPSAVRAKLDEILESSGEAGKSVSVISIDVDGMARFQDQHGHRFGDELLKRVAHILNENFKEDNFVGRCGGDEFLVVLPNSRAETAFVLSEEVRRLFADTDLELTVASKTVRYSVTIKGGIAAYPSDARESTDLLRKASEALYRAQQQGGDRICLPGESQMITKTNYYTRTQLERIASLAKGLGRTEAFLLREALDDLLHKYDDSRHRPQA